MSERAFVLVVVAVALVIPSTPGSATVIRVPLEQPTIQAGMDAATEGDTVLVGPGTYAGTGNHELDFGGTNMVVMSEMGPLNTIIDCGGEAVGFRAYSGEDSTSVIRGFTITNGYRSSNGGGMYISQAAVTIEDCVLSNNAAGSNGGGIYYGYCSTSGMIRNCVFSGNTSTSRGGGILCSHGDPPYVPPVIRNCVFYDNEAGTGGSYGGGGIFCSDSDATIIGCTLVRNAGGPGAGGVEGYSCYPVVRRSIVAFSTEGPGIYNVDADQCVIFGNAGGDLLTGMPRENLNTDPLFCDMASWDLTLCSNSPCLPGSPGNPWGELVGAYGSGCGECDSPAGSASWGSIKAMYRDE